MGALPWETNVEMNLSDNMTVRELMTSPAISVRTSDQVDAAFEIMRREGFRHLPVVDESGRVVGILSDRDIRNVTFVYEAKPTKAADYMTADMEVMSIMRTSIVAVCPDEPVLKALRRMLDGNFGCLPVIENDLLVGVVTAVDFLHLLKSHLIEAQGKPTGHEVQQTTARSSS